MSTQLNKGREEGRAEGLKEGFQKGEQEAVRKNALRMKQKGFSFEDIAEITGLGLDEISVL